MTADIERANPPLMAPSHRHESHVRVRYRAPFALRCGALLIDYIVLALVLTFSIIIARLMGGGARLAGGTAEKVGIILTLVVAVADLGVMAGLTGRSIGKWTTGLRIERTGGGAPGIPRALLRHFIGYPLSLIPFALGFLLVTVSSTGRALHDYIAGTVVVRRSGGPVVAPPRRRRK
ncbi:MAG TPA: RDD family protein [Pyrinomonadaceae bacterium]|nr:RDD family protein [Pyrinomonadaceae bacterium]